MVRGLFKDVGGRVGLPLRLVGLAVLTAIPSWLLILIERRPVGSAGRGALAGAAVLLLALPAVLAATWVRQTRAANRAALARLAQSEADYRQLAEHVSDMIVRVDRDLIRRYVSPASRVLLGYEPEELIGRSILEPLQAEDVEPARRRLQANLDGMPCPPMRYRLRHRDGHFVWIETQFRPVTDAATGQAVGLVGATRDISERRRAAAVIEASEARYQLLARHVTDLVMLVDHQARRLYVSPSVTVLLGYAPDEFARLSLMEVIHPEDFATIRQAYREMTSDLDGSVTARYRYRHKDGRWVWVEGIGRRTDDGSGYVMTVRDLTHRLEIEARLEAANRRLELLAMQDGLTGLANRRRLDEMLPIELGRAARGLLPVSLIMVDVDQFKLFNDTYGHQAGDDCLRTIAALLRQAVRRPTDLVARYGGEEIAALLPETDAAGARVVAERMRCAVRDRAIAHAAYRPGFVTVSLGVATIFPFVGPTQEARLIAAADLALYQAKANGRDRVAVAPPLAEVGSPSDPVCRLLGSVG